eukprot:TRINITY_DN70249_c0_g1_i1.p1 TRINITY_DN70249_c0_g1~~TRINITY_DN70249_c0_g1_i1.p1  ORF type:complete len:689 (+),score=96.20 TRINITY_DN70249_c0_g1_i1:241-2307(+)
MPAFLSSKWFRRSSVNAEDQRDAKLMEGPFGFGWTRKSAFFAWTAFTLCIFTLDSLFQTRMDGWAPLATGDFAFYALGIWTAAIYMKMSAKQGARESVSKNKGVETPSGSARQRTSSVGRGGRHAGQGTKSVAEMSARRGVGHSLSSSWVCSNTVPANRDLNVAEQATVGNAELATCGGIRVTTAARTVSDDAAAIVPELRASTSASAAACEERTSVAQFLSWLNRVVSMDGPVVGAALLERLEAENAEVDGSCYSLIVRALAKRNELHLAEKWMRRLQSLHLKTDEQTFATLMGARLRGGDAAGGAEWFRAMTEDAGITPSSLTYATMVNASAKVGNVACASSWLHRMVQSGVQLDSSNFSALLRVCNLKGDKDSAKYWLQEMRKLGICPTVMTYSSLIDACAKASDVDGAEEWMHQMQQSGIEPNIVSYCTMMHACGKTGNLARAEYWYAQMQAKGVEPNEYVYSSLIHACAQVGDVEAACSWLERGERAGVALDGVVYGCVINACGRVGDAERSMAVFQRMRAHGIDSHVVVYSALSLPFAYRGDWIEVENIRDMMVQDGIVPNDYFLYTMLLAYSRAKPREAQRAETEFRRALATGLKANPHLIKALYSAVGRNRCLQLTKAVCPQFLSHAEALCSANSAAGQRHRRDVDYRPEKEVVVAGAPSAKPLSPWNNLGNDAVFEGMS